MSPSTKDERREELLALYHTVGDCRECPLGSLRTNAVFGMGNADADLMFVGEAPGAEEDRQGLPFVGRAGKLLDQLLAEIGMERRRDAFIANVLKCLRYTAKVQLGDGTWERIGRLVRSRYAGEVMSVDSRGRLVPRRVIGWHATPLAGRRVYHLSYKSAKNVGAHRVGVELTGDHPVLTERGYVPVGELRPGDRIATGQGLSPVEKDVVCGTLLGDGHINGRSAYLFMGHSSRQEDYALFKAALLEDLTPRVTEHMVAAVVGGSRSYPVIHVRTLASRALGTIRREFYRPNKRVPDWIADELNERMLATWFMDDGYMRIRPPRQPSAEIATVGFEQRDLQLLSRGLQRLGLASKTRGGRLHFGVEATRTLSERIAPYVPWSMRYKLHPDIASRVPFDIARVRSESRRTQFDEVEVTDVTDKPRHDATFFCIDVEGTHNFVTGGGVVHNCRPPGNRDPQPEEIEHCKPYLMRQVQLVRPLVICTLGNFATKLLTGSPTGITRVRGRPQEREIAGLPVTLYPLFHPAAALRTPAVHEQLRQDFAGIPDLLERTRAARTTEPELATVAAGEPETAPELSQLDLFG